ncbi:GTPase HflX [Halobacterium bonnevillei]|uniref:GTPase HflX n=1 Tax=Halobacterium bonnevillei TaxID=2692200 RepID=A0A6B0SRA6_9EURY|nr:GTPase HflX [Halobacterium bonnevillei]MXR21390.1 GTPase HflX [Halobacterium bonnevillei]
MSRDGSTAIVAKRTAQRPVQTDEIRALCESAGLDVVGERTQVRGRDPTYDLGAGAVQDIADRVDRADVDVVVVDDDLDPEQAFSLEEQIGASVVDRTRLVLDIFADRAETKRARLEVRLAELRYELPRAEAKAKRGESSGRRGFKSGGEEPQAAQMRADYKQRIKHLRETLDQLDDADESVRDARRGSGFDLVALAGYTNAGKSTLLRRLADDLDVDRNDRRHDDLTDTAASEDRLFETLNTTTRRATVDDRDVLVTDTVGFVSDLPHWLVSSFRTTLAAAREADVVLLVVDASDSLETVRGKVETSLDELADASGTVLPVLNKRDVAGDLDAKRSLVGDLAGDPVVTSATENGGIDDLRNSLGDSLPDRERVELSVPNTDDGNAFVSWCHDHGTVRDPSYGDTIDFELQARREVAAKAEGRAAQLGDD